MQLLDQQVAPIAVVRPWADECTHFRERFGLGLAPLELALAADALAQLVGGGQRNRLDGILGAWVVHCLGSRCGLCRRAKARPGPNVAPLAAFGKLNPHMGRFNN
jgi:hypothetical protein